MIPMSASATSAPPLRLPVHAGVAAGGRRAPLRSPAQKRLEALAHRLVPRKGPRAIDSHAERDLRAGDGLDPLRVKRGAPVGVVVVPDDAPRMVKRERPVAGLPRRGIL